MFSKLALRPDPLYFQNAPLASWLFIKDGESIWIEQRDRNTMIVFGPAAAREQHNFPDEDAVQAFQIGLCEQLTNDGWFLWGLNRERRETAERRRVALVHE